MAQAVYGRDLKEDGADERRRQKHQRMVQKPPEMRLQKRDSYGLQMLISDITKII
jgi:hypothetical protein